MSFRQLAERYPVSGGDIKNAVLKAATMAAAEPAIDAAKKIHQWQLERAMDEVVAGRSVMQQSLFGEGEESSDARLMRAIEAAELRWRKTAQVTVVMAAGGIALGLIALLVVIMR